MNNTQSERLVAAAREVLKLNGYFVDNLWHIKDIHLLCEQTGLNPLSIDEAMMVFELANQQFDGEHGINWPQLERALHTYMQFKDKLRSLNKEEINA